MTRIKFGFAVLWLCLFSCQSSDESESDPLRAIDIDVSSRASISVSQNFNQKRFIVLDDEVMLGQIGETKLYDDRIYISTLSRSNGLFIFDMAGNYLGQFGSQGNGPGEYQYIQSFVIHNDLVYVLDSRAQRIDLYDLDGLFIKTLATGVYGFNMALFEGELIVYSGNSFSGIDNEGKKLLYYGLDGSFLRAMQDIDPKQAEFLHLIPQNVFSPHSRLYLEPFSDVIYQSQKTGLKVWKKLDFGRHSFPKAALDKSYENVAEFVQDVRKQDYAIFLSNLRETKDWLTFSYEYKDPKKPNWVVMDKLTEEVKVYNWVIEDLITEGTPLTFKHFKMVGTSNDDFIFAISPQYLMNSENALSNDRIQADGNPIIYLMSNVK